MNSEARNEFDAEYDDRVRKIRKAAAIALKELDQLRSGGSMMQETLDAQVARIAQEKLHPYGCDLVVHRVDDDVLIWLRNCNDEVNEGKVLPITLLEVPSQLPNGAAPISLWRQTMEQKSYWRSGWVTPERSVELPKIFGIKMHRIGKDMCEATCQTPK